MATGRAILAGSQHILPTGLVPVGGRSSNTKTFRPTATRAVGTSRRRGSPWTRPLPSRGTSPLAWLLHISRYALASSDGLTSVTIPESVERIANGAFEDCHCLISVYFEGNLPYLYDGDIFSEPYPIIYYYSEKQEYISEFGGVPAVMLKRSGLWHGAYAFDGGWLYEPWLGWFQIIDEDLGDIDHLLLGKCWVKPVNELEYWIRTSTLGWIYMRKDWSPWLWRMDDSHWYWLDQDAWPPRAWDDEDQEWEELRP